jgi:carbon monoxide dehydrogenase subunit G
MEMTGERQIPAPPETVWKALNDPDVLKRSIPGCEELEKTSETEFTAKVVTKIGPVKARFGGKVTLTDIVPPKSYKISGEGQGGAAGFAKGGAEVDLEPGDAGGTLMRYKVNAQIGGKMAQIGARLIDGTARKLADQFFDNFVKAVSPGGSDGGG